jgi:hypothetical protein
MALAEPDIFFKRGGEAKAEPAPAPVVAAKLEAPVQPPAQPVAEVKKTSVAAPVALTEPDIFFKRADAKAAAPAPAPVVQPQPPVAPVAPVQEVKTPRPPAPVVESKEEIFFKRAARITDSTGTAHAQTQPEPPVAAKPAPAPAPAPARTAESLKAASAKPAVASGLPFTSLEQIFVFTTGKGRPLFDSATFKQKINAIVGEPLNVIRAKLPVDVIGHMDLRVEETLEDGAIPDQALRTMSMVRPFVAGRAKEGLYHVCIRVLLAETNDVVTMFLFYSKAKKK